MFKQWKLAAIIALPAVLAAQSLISFGLGKFHNAPPAGTPVTDNFNQGALNTALWTFLNPAGGTNAMTGTQLQINVPGGALHDPSFGGVNNSVSVDQTIGNVNFIAITQFDSIPTQQYQFEGMLIKQDATNYLRIQFGSDGTNLICNASIIVAGVESSSFVTTNVTGFGSSVWLQVQRAGDGSQWTVLYSLDGSNYINVGAFSATLTVASLGIFGGNYNSTTANTPAFSVLANSFTGAGNNGGGGGGGGASAICPGSPTTRTSSGQITATTGGCYENLHITTTSGPCVVSSGASNWTIHNSEIGPCGTSDTNCTAANGQGVNVSGASNNVRILDNYIHPECGGSVTDHGQYDNGDDVLCFDSPSMLVHGNVLAWGKGGNVFTWNCPNSSIVGNFILNPMNGSVSGGGGNRGSATQILDNSRGVTIDHNYILVSRNTTLWKYQGDGTDLINFGSTNGTGSPVNAATITNNYVTGGDWQFGCGINMEGGMAQSPSSAQSVITGNNLVDSAACGISVESGYNYVISNNKVLNRPVANPTSVANKAFQAFQCYGAGKACGGADIPCGNIAYTNNQGYAINSTNSIFGIYQAGDALCSNVTFVGSANAFDSGTGPCPSNGSCAAFNSMQPLSTQLPVPQIPPLPFVCVVSSPYTNNTAVASCGS